MLSVSLPLKGREIPAVTAKSPMISPLYGAPPMLPKYAGNSGISMLKLEENKNELPQSSANLSENMRSEAASMKMATPCRS
jgi:hypothetical protein